jgi:hypothetical protein
MPVSALIAAAKLEAWGRKFQAPQYSIEIFTSALLYSANAGHGRTERLPSRPGIPAV